MKLRIDIDTDSQSIEYAIVGLLQTFGAVVGQDDEPEPAVCGDATCEPEDISAEREPVKPKRGPHGRRR